MEEQGVAAARAPAQGPEARVSPEQKKFLRVLHSVAVGLVRDLSGHPQERYAVSIERGLKKLLEGMEAA